jgi:hypothetical protein
MHREFLSDAEVGGEFSDALFKMIFGRKPNYRRDRQFLTRYLSTVQKTREEIINGYLKKEFLRNNSPQYMRPASPQRETTISDIG